MLLKQKYFKYKNKYLVLKNQLGGECDPKPTKDYQDLFRNENLLDFPPDNRITVNSQCYNIIDIYKWVIVMGKRDDLYHVPIKPEDIQRIRDTYNNRSLTVEDEQEFINRIRSRENIYKSATLQIRSNKNITLEAIRQDEYALKFASEELKADREVVLAAVT